MGPKVTKIPANKFEFINPLRFDASVCSAVVIATASAEHIDVDQTSYENIQK
jgi:hypothetical protein